MRHFVLTVAIPLILAMSVISIAAVSYGSDGASSVAESTDDRSVEVLSIESGNAEEVGHDTMMSALGILAIMALLGLAVATRTGWQNKS